MCQLVCCFSLGNLQHWSISSFLYSTNPCRLYGVGRQSFFAPTVLGLFKAHRLRQRSHKIQRRRNIHAIS